MESNVLIDNELGNSSELIINQGIKLNLLETAKWGRLLSIVGFIMIGLMLILGILILLIIKNEMSFSLDFSIAPDSFPTLLPFFYSFFFILISFIYIFPCLYLFRFSTFILREKNGNNIENYQNAFKNLKRLFKFFGILTVVLSIFAIVFLFAIIGDLSALLLQKK
ncbi:MAG: hypothetical protein IPL95_04930 [Saprospiraceae bacterium]|nr:hypothetical protein [Saprospiraceae bacterium]